MSDLVYFQPVRAWDRNGVFAPGAKASFSEPVTSTPRTVYADEALSIAHPSPLVADARGVFAAVYTNGLVQVDMTDASGTRLPGYPALAYVVPASSSGADSVTFSPTGTIPVSNVQAAIERVQTNAVALVNGAGIGLTGDGVLLADFNTVNTPSGPYRYDVDTAGTRPAGIPDAGTVLVIRQTATSFTQHIFSGDGLSEWTRACVTGVFSAWFAIKAVDDAVALGGASPGTDVAPSQAAVQAYVAAHVVVAVIEDQKTSGTDAQILAAGWNTRDLNTITLNKNTAVSLAANEFTMATDGWVEWVAPARDRASTRLYNVTDSVVVADGQPVLTFGGNITSSTGGAAVLSGKTYRIEQKSGTVAIAGTYAGNGTEVYTRVKVFA